MRAELEIVLEAARTLPAALLPTLLGELEQIRWTAMARLSSPETHQPQSDKLLDINEAASRLGVSTGYLYRHARGFPFTRRIGRKLLFSSLGINAYLRQRR